MNSQVRNIASGANVGSVVMATVIIFLVAAGCEQAVQRVAVSGQVLIDGDPVTKGTIRFVPESGRPSGSKISEDGDFRVVSKTVASGGKEIVGLVPGSYQIAVSSTESLGEAEDAGVRWLIPRRYGSFRTSGLETDIQAPNESMIVELTWEGAEETDMNRETEAGTDESSKLEEDQETQKKPKSDA